MNHHTRFDAIHIIPKLNAPGSELVTNMVTVITRTATQVGVPTVGIDDVTDTTLVIAIGGDGTMLEAMRVAAKANATSIGVNIGRIGFLTEISVMRHLTHDIAAALTLHTDTVVEERVLLQTSISDTNLACNEVSVSQLYADSLITYHLRIGQMDAGVHRANGILIATPTGSTAYSLSVGGALMMPEMEAIQIVPVAPATMTSRPIIVPSHTPVELHVWGGEVTVRTDGQVLRDERAVGWIPTKDNPYMLTIKPYKNKSKVLHFANWNFFDVLTEKLGWKHETGEQNACRN